MITIDGTFVQRLARKIEEEKITHSAHILAGIALSHEDYKSRCAVLRAYNNVLEWMDQIETDINRGD